MKGTEAIEQLKKKRSELHWWQLGQRIKYNRAIAQLMWMDECFDTLEINY